MAVSSVASRLSSLRGSLTGAGVRLADCFDKPLVEDIFNCAIKRQTGVTLRHMLDFGANPVERQLLLSAQFLHQELPVRLAHRVAELENLPYGLSAKPHVLKVRTLRHDCPATPSMPPE
jgi:pyruvate dehydrogenase kinase 2/3/4